MKNFFLLAGMICSAAIVFAQDKTQIKTTNTPPPTTQDIKVTDNPNAPEIKFETDVHDFGTLQKGAPCETEFKFTNTGKEPLLISNAQATCGCTVPSYPKDPIMPGKTGVIRVKYDSNRVGAFTKEVTITSNAKNNSVKITIKGKIDAPPKEETFPGNNNSGAPIGN